METQQQHIRSWDDLIFENRNQSYGAYAMRQGYANGLFKSVIAAASLLGVIILSSNSPAGKDLPPIKPIDSLTVEPQIYTIKPPDVKPPVQHITPPARSTNDLAIQIVSHNPIEKDSITLLVDESSVIGTSDDGTSTNSDTGVIGDGTGSGTDSGVGATNEPFTHVQVMPAYPGGYEGMMKFLKKKLRYPRAAEIHRIEGTSYIQFVIDPKGNVANVSVLKGFNGLCDQEAARVIGLLEKWSPGIQNNRTVPVRMVLPIKFKLND